MGAELSIWAPLLRAPVFRELEREIETGSGGVCLTGLVDGARALVLSLLRARTQRGIVCVLADDSTVSAYQRDLSALAALSGADRDGITVLPALDADPYSGIAPHPEVLRERVVALGRLLRGEIGILLTPARALLNPLPAPDIWRGWIRTLRTGAELPPESFVLACLGMGYRRVDIVSAPGEVSRRGGIIDIFPPESNEPVRIELFGDTIESLRSFDTDNQRSTGRIEDVPVGPASENPPTADALARLQRYLEGGVRASGAEVGDARQIRVMIEQLDNQGFWPGFETLTRLTAPRSASLLEHVQGMVLVVDEPDRTEEELARAWSEIKGTWQDSDNRVLPKPEELYADVLEVRDRLREAPLLIQELMGEEPAQARKVIAVASRSPRAYSGRVAELSKDLAQARADKVRTVCAMRASGSADRLSEILTEYRIEAARVDRATETERAGFGDGGIFIAVAPLRGGFEFPQQGLSVLAERELFGEERKTTERKSSSRAVFVSDFRDLKHGDHVVHIDHGIARFAGLGRPKGGSLNRDFMLLQFARGDRLFVPADRLDLVQKYSGVAGKGPVLDRLGGPGWERVKSRVRKSVESMAKELLELYARRKAARGHMFAEDTPWQQELEAAFPYELTPDQERALAEIKSDMQSERPTDRLLVGDVGFGKTELAVRATFKAVMDGYQVAILAPTTVLATQHFQTLCERYAPYPVKVGLVSRFRSAAEIKETLRDLEIGAVDVLVGTHRLLSKDVQFKRLGLLVVDEEQRFGVAHKERLQAMSVGVDVLSMTATPIPRTLQMSLAGVRDLSIIETPPPGRMAIQTYVIPFRKNVLTQAIRQELRRGGQVFVVHNRVETLGAMVRAIQEMAPEARVVAAHGKLPERQLESVMLRFVNRDADILVTTTIIENGLDIPTANTIIVNRADRFGLAQLYQLRGRVGRSDRHAYAYFVVPSRQQLSDEARKRLRALQEFSELGAGFRLAAADLEIRGAGELLGSRQHGHIASTGFDLYCQMLERAVHEMSGEPVDEPRAVNLHLGVDIKIPETYLADSADRLVVYKRLAQARSESDVDRLEGETEDRYGHLPPPVRNLFDLGRLRLQTERAGVKSVDLHDDRLQLRFYNEAPIDPVRMLDLLRREGGSLTPSGMMTIPAPPRDTNRIHAVAELLRRVLVPS